MTPRTRNTTMNIWLLIGAVIAGLGATALFAHYDVGGTPIAVIAAVIGVLVGANAMDRML